MKIFVIALGATFLLWVAGCSSQDQEKARADAQKATAEIKQDAQKAKADTKELGQRINEAVKPDSEKASDKLAQGEAKMRDATSKAGAKLDQAALVAKVKAKLMSDAGASTLTNVNVDTNGSVVTLSGNVATSDQKKAAEQAASQVDGVSQVINNLTVIAR